MASGCTITSKVCLLAVGLIYWVAAASLCFIGSWVFSTYRKFEDLTEADLTLVPASVMIAAGIFMFVIGLLGCIAACKENKCLLSLFFTLILVVLLGEVTAGIMGYVFRHKVEIVVEDGLDNALNNYNDTVFKHQMDYVQQELQCCGVKNATDWTHSSSWNHTGGSVPLSCCKNETGCSGKLSQPDQLYMTGCLEALENKFMTNLIYIASVTIAFAIVQIFGLISACILLCRSREVRYETLANAHRDGLRV